SRTRSLDLLRLEKGESFHRGLDADAAALLTAGRLGFEPELVELLSKLRHGLDVGAPERVLLRPADDVGDLLGGASVAVEHQAGGVAPPLGDGGALGAVLFDEVGEESAERLDLGSDGRGSERRRRTLLPFSPSPLLPFSNGRPVAPVSRGSPGGLPRLRILAGA